MKYKNFLQKFFSITFRAIKKLKGKTKYAQQLNI